MPTSLQTYFFLESSARRRKALISVSVVLGVVGTYLSRQSMNVDGISYLDVASAYARHDWSLAINGYWSPLYSWLLAIFLSIPHSIRTEYPIVHFVNLLCYLFALYGFHKFWSELSSYVTKTSSSTTATLPEFAPRLWDALGYGLFLYLFLQLIGAVSPDVLSSGFVFLAIQRALRWKQNAEHSPSEIVILALILALGYLSKAILLYFGVFLLLGLALHKGKKGIKPILITAWVFLLLALPWALALKSVFGELSFGFSGKLNYSWFVNGTEAGELLEPGGTNSPYFPGPKIASDPTAFSVNVIPHVTYWPWYDPVRVGRTKAPHFVPRQQFRTILKNTIWLRSWFLLEFGAITVAMLAFWISSGRQGIVRIFREWVLWGPVLIVFGLYGLVFIRSFRYIAAFTVVLFALGLGVIPIARTGVRGARAVLAAGMLMFVLINIPGTILGILQNGRKGFVQVAVAKALTARGIHESDVVGVIQDSDYFYWARLAHVSVGAEIWPRDSHKFWENSAEKQLQTVCAMAAAGIHTVVGRPPETVHPAGWSEIGKTGYYSYSMSASGCR